MKYSRVIPARRCGSIPWHALSDIPLYYITLSISTVRGAPTRRGLLIHSLLLTPAHTNTAMIDIWMMAH